MKRNKGITMISLVVTIIVLIILAGVSINMVVGDNGIITIAQKAKENTELAKIEEEEQLNNLYEEFQNSGGIIDDGSDTEAIEKLENFKKIIATAITNEGVTTAETDTAETMAENISKILQKRTENATATAEDIAEGKTAWVNGEEIIGIGGNFANVHVYYGSQGMPNDQLNGSWNITIANDNQYIYWIFDDSIFSGRSSFVVAGKTIAPTQVLNSGGIYIAKYEIGEYKGQAATLSAWNVSQPQSYHRQMVSGF